MAEEQDSKQKMLPPWTERKILDQFETNPLSQQIFESRYDGDRSSLYQIKKLFMEKYSYDIMSGTGPYIAVVLKVLSGPQANNSAATNDNLTNTFNHESLRDPTFKNRKSVTQDPPVRVIARIPEFDIDIDWPRDNKDEARIASHSEFHAAPNKNSVNDIDKIKPGDLIWVSYNNTDDTKGFSGKAPGRIIGLHEPSNFNEVDTRQSSQMTYNPPCKSIRQLEGPAGGLYVGQTVANPNINSGPPIRKIKNRIKTGMFGNGTIQTKVHFDQAMRMADTSFKHGISGPAPDSNNAFIWTGHLKSNGYLDLLDRPVTLGRETIIYAPMMLDLSSPIEIKYYFHDEGGFGHSWIHGPNCTTADAINVPNGNDFKEHIGPAIKDMIKDGRNFILVIPEMAHSRGFGTTFSMSGKISQFILGKTSNAENLGEKKKTTI